MFTDRLNILTQTYETLPGGLRTFSTPALRKILQDHACHDRDLIEDVIRIRGEIESMTLTIAHFDSVIINTESGIADATQMQGSISTLQQNENVKETAGVDIEVVDAGRSRNSRQGQQGVLDMSDFLSRPVSIYESTLGESVDHSIRIEPWDLFTLIPSVRAKLRNFAFLRGNLHVRISVSGTPFHYGRLLVSYQPYAKYNETLKTYATMLGLTGLARPLFLSYLSQAPGSSLINVNANEPLEIVLPFISTKPMHRLYNAAPGAIAAGTSLTDFQDSGSLFIYSLNQFHSVSTSPSDMYMQVYAWMEDVELGTNTATQLAITTESGKDERQTGPVQKIATALFDVSNKLSSVPVIGIYAKASAIAFGALSKVSAIFGWSKPCIMSAPMLVRPQPFENGALTIGYDTAKRVVIDPLQELTVDTSCCGVEQDDLVISTMASRVSYYQTFVWQDTDNPLTTPIWTSSVSPNCGQYFDDVKDSKVYNQPTAMAFAAQPFCWWRGDIIFRFEVVCSAFHRGKLGIYFEPNVAQAAVITASTSLNKQFIKVVDIQETQVFEVEVKWAAPRPWLLVGPSTNLIVTSDPALVNITTGFANGFIAVFPFTTLQSPDASNISINVYAYCNNLQVNGYEAANLPTSRDIYVESGSCIANVEISRIVLNDSTASPDGICEDYFGEQPLSFRALLKRFVGNQEITSSANTTHLYNSMKFQILPLNQLPYAATSNALNGDLFSHLRYAFLGIRGGIRVRIRPNTTNTLSNLNWVKLALNGHESSFSNTCVGSDTPNLAVMPGSVSFVPSTNGGVEAELPFYSSNLFAICFSDVYDDAGTYADNMEARWFRNARYTVDVPNKTLAASQFSIERAAGEDFSLLRFQGAPWYVGGVVI